MLVLIGLAACRQETAAPQSQIASMPINFPHDAYVWQRAWQPPLADALRQSGPLIHHWRVLAAHTDEQGQLQKIALAPPMLAASKKPMIAVIRIEHALDAQNIPYFQQQILALRRDLLQKGLQLEGMEIDYDASLSQLKEYAGFLGSLRQALQEAGGLGRQLSITALPTWLESADLDLVWAQVDHLVLQVHGLDVRNRRLFDVREALAWVKQLSARGPRAFWVALPNYGSRLHFDSKQKLTAVESEAPVAPTAHAQELLVRPQEVAEFLAALRKQAPPSLRGVVWFRLPTARDQRSWSLQTWHAVMRGLALHARLHVSLQAAGTAHTYHLVLQNNGEIDANLPGQIRVDADCSASATSIIFQQSPLLIEGQQQLRFVRQQEGMLRAGKGLLVGKLICKGQNEPELKVFP